MIIRRKNLTLAILVLFVMDMVLMALEGHVIVRIVRFIVGVAFYVLLCSFSFFEGVAADDDYLAGRYCPYKTCDDLQAYEEADFECDGNCRECVSRMWEE